MFGYVRFEAGPDRLDGYLGFPSPCLLPLPCGAMVCLIPTERYLKQAIVDKNALVSSSALVSGVLLYKISPEVCFPPIEWRYSVS